MKTLIKLPFFAMLALLMWACTNDDMMPEGSDWLTGKPVEITVGGMQTRAGYAADDVITSGSLGIWMEQDGTMYDVANLEVKYESGAWTPQGKLMWKNATDNVTYTAAWPYDADGVYDVTVPDVQTNDNAKAAEVLYATGTAKGADGAINITFEHALAQVKVALSNAPQFTTIEVKSVKLNNVATTGTFTAASGIWSNFGTYTDVSFIKNSNTEFEALLIPHMLTNYNYIIEIVATVDGTEKIFRYTAPTGITLERGETYTIPVQIGKS